MPIFFGCTGNNTEATIATVKFAKDNGADGAILAAPSYICAPEADIECFFLDVADATDLPLGIYNNPPRVKSDLHWDHLLRIFKHPNYVVHKESTARVGQVAQVLAGKPDVAREYRDKAAAIKEETDLVATVTNNILAATVRLPSRFILKPGRILTWELTL
jgi:dihydrodipicolinate synthase/N-acetylneuraminate lyase